VFACWWDVCWVACANKDIVSEMVVNHLDNLGATFGAIILWQHDEGIVNKLFQREHSC